MDYRKAAIRILTKKNLGRWVGHRDEFISRIMEALIDADKTFDESKCYGDDSIEVKRLKWRGRRAFWAISDYLKVLKREHKKMQKIMAGATYEFDEVEPIHKLMGEEDKIATNKVVNFFLNNSGLTPDQNKTIHEYYFDDKTVVQISKDRKVSTQNVRELIAGAISKMKATAGVST